MRRNSKDLLRWQNSVRQYLHDSEHAPRRTNLCNGNRSRTSGPCMLNFSCSTSGHIYAYLHHELERLKTQMRAVFQMPPFVSDRSTSSCPCSFNEQPYDLPHGRGPALGALRHSEPGTGAQDTTPLAIGRSVQHVPNLVLTFGPTAGAQFVPRILSWMSLFLFFSLSDVRPQDQTTA